MKLELRGTVTLIEVFDVNRSIEFYRDMLGFEVTQTAGPPDRLGWASLRSGNVELMLNSMIDPDDTPPPAPDPARVAAHRDTTLYIGCPDVDGAFEFLRRKGLQLDPPCNTHYGMRQLPFSDPDGYALCLQWPISEGSDNGEHP
jgi:glyoxylase I family protein